MRAQTRFWADYVDKKVTFCALFLLLLLITFLVLDVSCNIDSDPFGANCNTTDAYEKRMVPFEIRQGKFKN